MNAQAEIQKLLQKGLLEARCRNPAYSLRAFSRRLKIPFSALSEIMNGKRPVTRRMGKRILDGLCIEPGLSQEVLSGLSRKNGAETSATAGGLLSRPREFAQLNMDQFHLISGWQYFAIYSLAETEDFRDEPEWIASRLGLPVAEAATALERLERLGMLQRGPSGRLGSTGTQVTTSTDIANLSLRKRHYQNLDLARESLDVDSVAERDFSFITMAGDPAKLPELKERIQRFRRELCEFFESGPKKEVFQLCIQLFPLSVSQNVSNP